MRFAHPWWLSGSALGLVVAAALVLGAWLHVRAVRRFGDEARVGALVTTRAAGRRALKGVLLVLAVTLGFVALAQPQYGRGTRYVPATNLDVVVVLDYSKSMYARDVTPSRTERAKVEVSRLIAELPGARFGAVAFAGEPLSFPLTSDGGAIAQFFRQLSPDDMPVGGTAIGRALGAGMDLFRRDPVSARHRRVLVLVTDGEDLEGDPVSVAESAAKEHVTVHVVQIGGRTPEPIPQVDESGAVIGWRKDSHGQPLTTSLSSDGEEQLGKIAQAGGGNVVRSERGDTGITEVTNAMRRLMTEELSERVETVYADVYLYPTALAFLLLLAEAFVPEASRKKRSAISAATAKAVVAALLVLLGAPGCKDGRPFLRNAPAVDEAIASLRDGGDPARATDLLATYLSTGECKDGEIGTPDSVRERQNASFDLGLALFRVAERFGGKFGDDPKAPPALAPGAAPSPRPPDDSSGKRDQEVDCALRVVRVVAAAPQTPPELRAKAEYLTGNLEFLRGKYEDAVAAYDSVLKLLPALPTDKEDALGARAAWNRAIALRRIEDEKNKPDAAPPDRQDGGQNEPDGGDQQPDSGKKDQQNPDGGQKPKDDQKDQKKPDDENGKQDDKDQKDQKKSGDDRKKPPEKDQGKENDDQKSAQQKGPKPPSLSQDERMLDELEQAPTVQEETAKRNAGRMKVRGMEDK